MFNSSCCQLSTPMLTTIVVICCVLTGVVILAVALKWKHFKEEFDVYRGSNADPKLHELKRLIRPFFQSIEHEALGTPEYAYRAEAADLLSAIKHKKLAIDTNSSLTTTATGFGFLKEFLVGKTPLSPKKTIIDYVSLMKGERSYILDKQDIYVCLHDEDGDYYRTNYLVYVILHEVTHFILENEIGHTDYFYQVFDQLLQEAIKKNLYDPTDPIPRNYCKY